MNANRQGKERTGPPTKKYGEKRRSEKIRWERLAKTAPKPKKQARDRGASNSELRVPGDRVSVADF